MQHPPTKIHIIETIKAPIRSLSFLLLLSYLTLSFGFDAQAENQEKADMKAFEKADQHCQWKEVLFDPGTEDWEENWFLDGKVAAVENVPDGLHLRSGPRNTDHGHHMVLWTKQSFAGNFKLEYEFTRTDFEYRGVCIVYLQATGSGEGPYKEDIWEWRELREEPWMKHYFENLNTYHVSYAAYGNNKGNSKTNDYVRARRYLPSLKGLKGSELLPDYSETGLFKPGVTYKFTIIKVEQDLSMRVVGPEKTSYFHWHNDKFPAIEEGRIGFRQMFMRSAIYKNIRISLCSSEASK